MKKAINLVLIFVFLVSLTTNSVIAHGMGGSNSSSGSPSDVDPESLQTLQEVEAALGDAKQKLADAGFSLALLKKIKQLEQRLMDIAVDGEGAPPTKCASIVDQATDRTVAAIQQITKKICSETTTQRIAFRGMCNPFLSNFSECEAKEHGHGGGHESSGHMSEPPKPKCLSAEEAQIAIADLQRAKDALDKLNALDTDANGIPNFCEK